MKSRQRKELLKAHKRMYAFYLAKLAPENVEWVNNPDLRKFLKMRKQIFNSRAFKKSKFNNKLNQELIKVQEECLDKLLNR